VRGEFTVPSFVSGTLRDLIDNMLQYHGKNRPTVKEVLKSRWLLDLS
jgi:hypothetical protein